MTNDEINKLANEAMQSITVDDDEDYASGRGAIEYVIRQAVTTALEEAAKVASNRVMYWIEQPIFTDTDNRFNSAREAEARAIELAIRALKPVQP